MIGQETTQTGSNGIMRLWKDPGKLFINTITFSKTDFDHLTPCYSKHLMCGHHLPMTRVVWTPTVCSLTVWYCTQNWKNTCENPIRLLDQYTTFHIPASTSKVMGSISRKCKKLWNIYLECKVILDHQCNFRSWFTDF